MPRLKPLPSGPPPIPMFWRADPGGRWTWSCSHWSRLTGLSEAASLGDGWLEAIHPQDREAAARPLVEIDGTCLARAALRLRLSGRAGYLRIQPTAASAHSRGGELLEWVGTMLEQDSLAGPVDRDAVALRDHMRGALALIRSLARRTAQTSATLDHYATHFEGRLDAFARVQDAVIRSPDGGVDLEALIREELVASRFGDAGHLRVEGPHLRLVGRAAEAFVLAIHELAINAVKFGALTTHAGAVSVSWTIDHRSAPPTLLFRWSETGVTPATAAPRRRGFGTELIERGMPVELQAETRLDFLPGEVRCSIALPLTHETATGIAA